jgi:4-carboxymuconolactone decarboxylase
MPVAAARVAPLEPPYEPPVEEYLTKLMPPDVEPLKLFRTFAVNLELASRMRPLGAYFLAHPTIEPRERELIILRTTARNDAEYEWGVHAAFFKELSHDEIAGTVPGSDYPWPERDRLLLSLADELDATGSLSDNLWNQLCEHWSHSQLLELIVLAGWYRTISYVINALGIEHEDWAARFPEASR